MFSGLSLNKQKSEAMGIGTNRNINLGFGLRWVDQIKLLGIYFCSTKCASELDRNWIDRIIKIKQEILNWGKKSPWITW